MKRTKAGEVLTGFLQHDPRLDHLNDVSSSQYFINKFGRYHGWAIVRLAREGYVIRKCLNQEASDSGSV